MEEKVFKKMGVTGAGNIAIGVIILTFGIVCGIMTVINGALMLSARKELTF